ncbi:MAG: hypothetical protein LW875_00930 [Proteobacteria bacterium]|jgi:hypothetical protein|nr:hypothetical protein [Pseudomonadota bacterium]
MKIGLGFLILCFGQVSAAQLKSSIKSVAKKDGQVVYLENHMSDYGAGGQIVRARTEYTRRSGEVIAVIDSEFKDSLSAPAHFFEDKRTGHRHGIRYENGQLVLFSQDKGKSEETKTLTIDKASPALTVGCQGLFYYLQQNYDELVKRKKIPLKFMIPGKLEYYDFEMELVREVDGVAYIEVHIKNWFLRLFAPKLDVRYDIKSKRMIYYKGLSNLQTDKGETQAVEIEYSYN